jgi:hypothetical protein
MSDAPSKAPVTTPPARKLGMIDTLVARDQTAVFWFIVACAVATGCAWYLVLMAEALKDRPPFVVMDTAGAYYVAPGMNFDTMDAMHENLAQLAVETLFERGPTGLARLDRVEKLFTQKGIGELQDILKKENDYFQRQEVEQTIEFYPDSELRELPASFFPPPTIKRPTKNPAVLIRKPTAVSTWAVGLVTRRGVFKGQTQTESYRCMVIFAWKMNPDPRGNQSYPAVVDGIKSYNLEKISDL